MKHNRIPSVTSHHDERSFERLNKELRGVMEEDIHNLNPLLPIMKLPLEILLNIMDLLDIPEILRLRQTCRTLFKSTQERIIWITKLKEQSVYLPLPSELSEALYRGDECLHAYTTPFLEKFAKEGHRQQWLEPRTGKVQILKNTAGITSSLMGLRIFRDRWLVAIYHDGMIFVYDTNIHRGSALCASLVVEESTWSSFAMSMDPAGEILTVALARYQPPYTAEIYCLNFSEITHDTTFRIVDCIALSSNKVIQAIKPAEKLVIVSMPGAVEILGWDEQKLHVAETKRNPITLQLEDLEGLWNGIIAVTFIGPYILVFKTRSVEICNKAWDDPAILLKHEFPMTFRAVSFSDCITSRDMSSHTVVHQIMLFAYDVIQGLFHYTVRLTVLPRNASEMHLSLDVRLTGVYPLALGVIHPHPRTGSPAASTSSDDAPMTFSANFSPVPAHGSSGFSATASTSHRENNSTPTPASSNSNYGSRGFLSAHSLGPQGKRGIWVERKRSSIVREVQVWAQEPPSGSPQNFSSKKISVAVGSGENFESAVEIERRVVFTSNSYDLRDDITCCTFGEVSGTIALGHRSGEISVIRLSGIS